MGPATEHSGGTLIGFLNVSYASLELASRHQTMQRNRSLFLCQAKIGPVRARSGFRQLQSLSKTDSILQNALGDKDASCLVVTFQRYSKVIMQQQGTFKQ